MVGFYQAYKGSVHTPLIYHGNKLVKKVYHGNVLVYQIGFSPVTFYYTGELQTFHIPLGIDEINIDCVAGKGAFNGGGLGGRVQTTLKVTPDSDIYLWVGRTQSTGQYANEYNASDIRTSNVDYLSNEGLSSRLIVAGGGGTRGGSGSQGSGGAGGDGGGLVGADGADGGGGVYKGYGGTQTSGGAGGATNIWTTGQFEGGRSGQFGLGGRGSNQSYGFAGAGGAGWYGGGSGACVNTKSNGYYGAGGGGGSSYTDPDLCSNTTHTQGYQDGDGYITISV